MKTIMNSARILQLFAIMFFVAVLFSSCSQHTCYAYTRPGDRLAKAKNMRDRSKGARNIQFPVTTIAKPEKSRAAHI
ncbi:MAG TPA: hypothetical protein VHO46_16265 [Bacteroidales bacterium]|nr:hypothetical protein [Bacteroidales bacterium]